MVISGTGTQLRRNDFTRHDPTRLFARDLLHTCRSLKSREYERNQAMTARPMKAPGPDHPITIAPNPARVVVTVAGRVIADSRAALTMREASYAPVQYIPRKDVDMTLLQRTQHASYCPYKGDCAYYSIAAGGERSVNAVWTYEAPFPDVAQIKDHVAFYPTRVDAIEER